MVSDAAVLVLLGDWGILRTHNLVRDLLIIFTVSLAFFVWILRPGEARSGWRRRGRAEERKRKESQPEATPLQRDDERRPSCLTGSTRGSPDEQARRAFEPKVSSRRYTHTVESKVIVPRSTRAHDESHSSSHLDRCPPGANKVSAVQASSGGTHPRGEGGRGREGGR